eukprot:3062770-Karenia_brevis.AAC.1
MSSKGGAGAGKKKKVKQEEVDQHDDNEELDVEMDAAVSEIGSIGCESRAALLVDGGDAASSSGVTVSPKPSAMRSLVAPGSTQQTRKWHKFDPQCPSIETRHPTLYGRLLADELRGTYIEDEDTRVRYYSASKARLMVRNPDINDRDEAETRRNIKESCKQRGFVEGGRNEIVVIPQFVGSEFYYVLGGAHTVEAIYEAYEEEGDSNEHLQATIAAGLKVTVLKARTPPDVQRWFKEEGNSLKGSSGRSFLEYYNSIDRMRTAYAAHVKEQVQAKGGQVEA